MEEETGSGSFSYTAGRQQSALLGVLTSALVPEGVAAPHYPQGRPDHPELGRSVSRVAGGDVAARPWERLPLSVTGHQHKPTPTPGQNLRKKWVESHPSSGILTPLPTPPLPLDGPLTQSVQSPQGRYSSVSWGPSPRKARVQSGGCPGCPGGSRPASGGGQSPVLTAQSILSL